MLATSTYLLGTSCGGLYSAKKRSSQVSSRFFRDWPVLGVARIRTERSGLHIHEKRVFQGCMMFPGSHGGSAREAKELPCMVCQHVTSPWQLFRAKYIHRAAPPPDG